LPLIATDCHSDRPLPTDAAGEATLNLETTLKNGDYTKHKQTLAREGGKTVASVTVDLLAASALVKLREELRATRVHVAVHTVHLADPQQLDERVDALQVGISVLGMGETLSPPVDLGRRKGRAHDHAAPNAALEMRTRDPEAKGEAAAQLKRSRDELAKKLKELPEAEQAVVLNLYGVDLERKHGLSENRMLLGTLRLPLSELRTPPPKDAKDSRGSKDKGKGKGKGDEGAAADGDWTNVRRSLEPVEQPKEKGGRRGGGGKAVSVGALTMSVSVLSALRWLPEAVREDRKEDEKDGRRTKGGKERGEATKGRDSDRDSDRDRDRGRDRDRSEDDDDERQRRGEEKRSPLPLALSPISGRQRLHLNALSAVLTADVTAPLSERACLIDDLKMLVPLEAPSYLLELDDIASAPPPPELARDEFITRRAMRVAILEMTRAPPPTATSSRDRYDRYDRYDPARPSSAPPPSAASGVQYAFFANTLSLDVDYDEKRNQWLLPRGSRELLLRSASMPRGAQLLLELTVTIANRPKGGGGGDRGGDRAGARAGDRAGDRLGRSGGRDERSAGVEPEKPEKPERVVVLGWGALPLETISAAAGGGSDRDRYDPARSGSRDRYDRHEPPTQHVVLEGGTIFRPRDLAIVDQGRDDRGRDDRSRDDRGRDDRGRGGSKSGGGPSQPTSSQPPSLTVRVSTLPRELTRSANLLPANVLLPTDILELAAAARKLLAAPPEAVEKIRDLDKSLDRGGRDGRGGSSTHRGGVATAAEQASVVNCLWIAS
jgi:hypothetical protein